MSAARQRTPGAERARRCRLNKARGKIVLEDVVVDRESFEALLEGRGLLPSTIKDKRRQAKEAGTVLNEAGRRWLEEFRNALRKDGPLL